MSSTEYAGRLNSNRSPYLNVMPDALEAVWQRVDELGRLYLPGMTSGLQTQLSRNTERLRELANNRQVYDARDFGLRSEQGDRNEYIINGVINAAARNGGGVVYIPPGNWGLLNYITPRSGVSIIGAGTGATILRPRGTYAAIQRLPDDDSYLSDCLFQDFAIDGSEQTLIGDTTYDSRIKGFYFFFFKRCFFNRLLIQEYRRNRAGCRLRLRLNHDQYHNRELRDDWPRQDRPGHQELVLVPEGISMNRCISVGRSTGITGISGFSENGPAGKIRKTIAGIASTPTMFAPETAWQGLVTVAWTVWCVSEMT
ncbi:glycosyl hydrolase family 28-related protein [Klebsiella pneumoniae]|uniref:glycosyl hydrolase family 28-related protein n=1 Tax=Klebsiella pneumoniae TaxID=573 RepID=UPI001425665B|nr:glycosyl hydrolase family 28-related protein [Klebsiella pneumoniae]